MLDRPPPTGYRDEHGVLHPGPGSAGYCGHLRECQPCFRAFGDALNRDERWAEVLLPLPQLPPIEMPIPGPGMPREGRAPVPTCLPGPGEGALIPVPRSLPALWRRYATPGTIISGAAGAAGALLLPTSVGAVLVIVLLVAAAAIHRYVPDLMPAARIRR